MYEAHIFQKPFQTNMQIGNDYFVFKYRLRVKKNVKIHINYIEINVKLCRLCAHHVMTSIIHHTRRPNCQ